MAANLADYAENAILDGTAMPATLYVQLHIGAPGEAGTANVATETTRKSMTRTAGSGGVSTNVEAQTWTSYPAAETVSHITIWSASSAGNCWWQGALTASQTLAIGNTLTIAIGSISLTMT
jgi:hypothetical protein